ncbi:glycosyltransferase 87 family protein [Glutamicibacter sp. 287]|nr:glycosyltransferase 87 family protein [Glutamicibacter sp. BW80]
MQALMREAKDTETQTVSALENTLRLRNISLDQAAQRTGVPVKDLHKLCIGDATGIRLSTLAVLCSKLDCNPDDVLQVEPKDPPASKLRGGIFRRAWDYQSRWMSIAAVFFSALISVCFLVGLVSQVNPVDFYVYHFGAGLAAAGENIYAGNIHGNDMPAEGLPFTYTPFAALAFLPLNVLTADTAYLLWSIASAMTMGLVMRSLLPSKHRNQPVLVGIVGFLASCSIVMASHIIFGQINVFLMALVLIDVGRNSENRILRFIPRGVLVGVAAAVKLTPALFIVYFVVTGQKRAALNSSMAALTATVVAAFAYPTMSIDFATRVLWNLSDRVSLDGLFATSGNNSIQGAFAALGDWTAVPAQATTLIIAVLGLYAATSIFRRGGNIQAAIVVGLTACMVSPVSWMHHWVYLLPGLLVLWDHGGTKVRNFCLASGLILVATGPNLGDVLFSLNAPALFPLAMVLRESLLLIGVCIVALLVQQAHTRVTGPILNESVSR